MKYLYTALALLASFIPAYGATINVNNTQSLATIQTAVNNANVGDTVQFAAGSYSWNDTLAGKCGVLYQGPTATPATVIITETGSGHTSFSFPGCTSGTTQVSYIGFLQGGIYYANANFTGVTVTHDQFGALPSSIGGGAVASAALYFDGALTNTDTNVTIQYNSFGDANSCTAVFATVTDEGGYCAGIYNQSGTAVNWEVSYNTFNHVEEGLHLHQICSGCAKGSAVSVTKGFKFRYNYLVNWHRIGVEVQTAMGDTNSMLIAHNLAVNPINPSWGTMFISEACCTGGPTNGVVAPAGAINSTYDNVLIADSSHVQTVGTFQAPVYGIEFWGGAGSFADWNWIGYGGSNGITWGYNNSPIYARNNYVCGMVGGSYITDEEGSGPLTQVNNVTSATCTPRTTTIPTIAQSATQVTITDSGLAGVPDAQPISIFYTTDGSTPTVNSTLYTGPFTPATGATIKAIGMWGVAPMPTVQLSGYGYIPSAVVSLVFAGQSQTTPPPVVVPPSITCTLTKAATSVTLTCPGVTIQ